jgi:DNA-binding MarR family transcriptional regulator
MFVAVHDRLCRRARHARKRYDGVGARQEGAEPAFERNVRRRRTPPDLMAKPSRARPAGAQRASKARAPARAFWVNPATPPRGAQPNMARRSAIPYHKPMRGKARSDVQQLPTPPELGDLLRLDLQLCFALYAAGNQVTRLYRPLLDPLGLTYPQYLAMMALWESGPQTVGALGRRLGLDSGTLTPLFTRLQAAGLITRERDKADLRRVLIRLTDAGRALQSKAADIPWTVFCQLRLTPDQAVGLKDALTRLAAGLRGAAPDAGD